MANKNDLTAFNPQIAAFAMPQSSPLTEAGNAMIKGSDFIWAQKLNGIKAKAGELELKRAQQEYDKAEAINPIEIASKQAALDDSVKTYAQNDLLRPLALKEATAKANKAAFDDDTKEIKFNSELAKDRASINRDDAIASNYFANAREQNIKNSVLEDDVKQNNFRLNAYANLNDVKELDKNHKDAIGAILSDEKLNAKQKYENIRLRNGAYEKQRNAINSFEALSRKDMPRGSAINPFETDMAFERLGGELPEYIKTADAQTRLAYKDAYVKTQTDAGLNKAVAAINDEGEMLKNLPVGQQNKIQNARAILDMFVPYTKDLVANESQISGIQDNITAPAAKFLGLNADRTANLYADAEAIAERIKATTKGGGAAIKRDAYNAIQPVNTFFNTTIAGNTARIRDQLAVLKETADMFKAQGNYKGGELIESQLKNYVDSFPNEISSRLKKDFGIEDKKGKTDDIAEDFAQKAQMNKNARKPGNIRHRAAESDFYNMMDENGGAYIGDGGPLTEEW
jgi:hypothetical protein